MHTTLCILKTSAAVLLALTLACSLAPAAKSGGKSSQKADAPSQIKLGICTSIDNAEVMKPMGYDYVELGLSSVAGMSDAEFAKLKAKVDASPLKPESMNGFMKSPLTVVGPNADLKPIEDYMKKAFARADALGTKILVYGSASTRKVPEGFPREKAEEQLVAFFRLASDCAKPYPGLTIVIEPLRPQESNFINTIKEGLDLVKKVDRPNVRAFADLYHMGVQQEPMDAIYEGGAEWFKHCHIARTEGRKYPQPGDSSQAYYEQFFKALRDIGYQGRVSIEGSPEKDLKADAPGSFTVMRTLADGKAAK